MIRNTFFSIEQFLMLIPDMGLRNESSWKVKKSSQFRFFLLRKSLRNLSLWCQKEIRHFFCRCCLALNIKFFFLILPNTIFFRPNIFTPQNVKDIYLVEQKYYFALCYNIIQNLMALSKGKSLSFWNFFSSEAVNIQVWS